MNCNKYENQFSDYLDGLLNQESGDELRFHLNGCTRCQTKIEDMERSILAVRAIPAMVPTPEFEQVLRSRLHTARTRELYAVPFLVSIKESFSEMALFTRQRTVRLVFATSLLLTIAVISGISSFPAEPTMTNLDIPSYIEHELASWDIISPIPFEPELAPEMAISLVSHQFLSSKIIPNTPVAILTNSAVGTSHPSTNNNTFTTIPTMDAQTSLESTVASTAPQQRLDAGPLTNQTINLNVSRQRDVNAFMTGEILLNSNRVQAMKRLTRPASQIKRIRISF